MQRALARSVGADHADALAEVNLLRERRHESGDPDRAQVKHETRRVAATDTHGDRLVCDRRRRRAAGSEPAPPRFHRVGPLGPVRGIASALLERLHQPEQPPFLLVPALHRVPEPPLAILPGLGDTWRTSRHAPTRRCPPGSRSSRPRPKEPHGRARSSGSSSWTPARGCSSASFAGTSRKLSGSSSSSTSASEANSTSSTSCLRSPPDSVRRRPVGDLGERARGRCAGTPRPTGPPAHSRRARTSRRSPRPASSPPTDRRPRAGPRAPACSRRPVAQPTAPATTAALGRSGRRRSTPTSCGM